MPPRRRPPSRRRARRRTAPRQPSGPLHLTSTIIIAVLGACTLAGAGGLLTSIGPWYRNLRKPGLQPPDWLFGPAWTLILGMAAAAFVLAYDNAPDPAARTLVATLFATNAALHLLWSPLFFKAQRPDWALYEVPFLWLSILAMMILLAPYSAALPWLLAPYLLWVGFATWLNWQIVRLNAPFGNTNVMAGLDPATHAVPSEQSSARKSASAIKA